MGLAAVTSNEYMSIITDDTVCVEAIVFDQSNQWAIEITPTDGVMKKADEEIRSHQHSKNLCHLFIVETASHVALRKGPCKALKHWLS